MFTNAPGYNTINGDFRVALSRAVDEAEADADIRVILLRAEGKAFCAGYGLDWTTTAQGEEEGWDSVRDMREFIGPYVDTFQKLWSTSKPTLAAVHGWCVGGGTDLVLCCDIVIADESAVFGYPPARVYGIPTTAMWVYRMGVEPAKRYLFTGDEISAAEAVRTGLILETVPAERLQPHAFAMASRIARVPLSQLVMVKMHATRPSTIWDCARVSRWVPCLTGWLGTHAKARPLPSAPARSGGVMRCANATTHLAITGPAQSND